MLRLWPPAPVTPLRVRSRTVTLNCTPSSGEMANGGNWMLPKPAARMTLGKVGLPSAPPESIAASTSLGVVTWLRCSMPTPRGERKRGAHALTQPGREHVGATRAAKDFAEQGLRRVARKGAAEALPVLRRIGLDDRKAEAPILIREIANDAAAVVGGNLQRRGHRVASDDVEAARRRAEALAAVEARVDRRQPVARHERAPGAVRRDRSAVDEQRRERARTGSCRDRRAAVSAVSQQAPTPR